MTPENKTSFKIRVNQWAEKIGVSINTISFRSMRRKWASCSTAGHLTFDNFLLELPYELQDYAIVHELIHLKIPNHGKLWKCLISSYLEDYKEREARLQQCLSESRNCHSASSAMKNKSHD